MHYYIAYKDGVMLSYLQSPTPSPYLNAVEVTKEEFVAAGCIVDENMHETLDIEVRASFDDI